MVAFSQDRPVLSSLLQLQYIRHGVLLTLTHLKDKSYEGVVVDQKHGLVLGEAIGGDSLPELEVLSLPCDELLGDEDGVVPTMAGLELGESLSISTWGANGQDLSPSGSS